MVGVMHSLKNLKGKTSYDGISVTKDTLFERSMIQEWTKRVKAKNEKEPSDSKYVWRVRRSPSKGLYMKRIEKRWPLSTDQPQAIRVGLPLDRYNLMYK